MDDEFKKAIVDFYTPEELLCLLELNDEEFFDLLGCLEDKLEENEEHLREEMRFDDRNELS
jgi:hypothetical protein